MMFVACSLLIVVRALIVSCGGLLVVCCVRCVAPCLVFGVCSLCFVVGWLLGVVHCVCCLALFAIMSYLLLCVVCWLLVVVCRSLRLFGGLFRVASCCVVV